LLPLAAAAGAGEEVLELLLVDEALLDELLEALLDEAVLVLEELEEEELESELPLEPSFLVEL
jgi:hypothetical protein